MVQARSSWPGLGRERCWDGEEELDSQERQEEQTRLGSSHLLLWTLGSWAVSAPPPGFLCDLGHVMAHLSLNLLLLLFFFF